MAWSQHDGKPRTSFLALWGTGEGCSKSGVRDWKDLLDDLVPKHSRRLNLTVGDGYRVDERRCTGSEESPSTRPSLDRYRAVKSCSTRKWTRK